jgi:hypothetical protein
MSYTGFCQVFFRFFYECIEGFVFINNDSGGFADKFDTSECRTTGEQFFKYKKPGGKED